MTTSHELEDLLTRGRRRQATAAEQRELERSLEQSAEARLLWRAGEAFDREGAVRPGDETLLQRLVAGTPTQRPLPRSVSRTRHLSRWTKLALVAALFGAGSAVASVALQWPVPFSPSPNPPPETPATAADLPAKGRVVARPGGQPRTEAETATAVAAPASPAADLNAALTQPVLTEPTPARPAPPLAAPVSQNAAAANMVAAATLFADGNALRRSGNDAAALQRYTTLLSLYPSAPEAKHAHLSVAELYMQQGKTAAALTQFRAYGEGPLHQEALWGECRALRALAHTEAELEALGRLRARYPNSPYALAATRRVSDLQGRRDVTPLRSVGTLP